MPGRRPFIARPVERRHGILGQAVPLDEPRAETMTDPDFMPALEG
jgi:hypothetical protein